MNKNEIKSEFGQIILESYSIDEIKLNSQLTEVLQTSYEFNRVYAFNVLEELYEDPLDVLGCVDFDDLMHLASSFIRWWIDLE